MDLQQIIQLLSQRLAIDKPPTPPAAVAGARPSQQSATSSSQHSPDNPASVPNPQYNTPPTSVHHWLRRRRLDPGHCRTLISPSVRKRLPWRWAESYWDTENLDKIFSCKWLDDRHALIGTKCHQLRLLDTGSGESHIVPTGSTTDTIRPQEPMKPRGIHTISMNPDRQLLVANSAECQHLTLYDKATMTPRALLKGHEDLVYSSAWLQNDILVSGSRDHSLALWRIPEKTMETYQSHGPRSNTINQTTSPGGKNLCVVHEEIAPVFRAKQHQHAVRSVKIHPHMNYIITLSLDGSAKIWDPVTMEVIREVPLKFPQETTSMAVDLEHSLFCIGSQTRVSFFDIRADPCDIHSIPSLDHGAGIRSLSWRDDQITVGGGLGRLSWIDCRTFKYIRDEADPVRKYRAVSPGWINEVDLREINTTVVFSRQDVQHAVYAHDYDSSGARLLVTGGPLQVALRGSYLGLFQ